jgi:hypothetical protein
MIQAQEQTEELEREKGRLDCEECKLRECLDLLTRTYGDTIEFLTELTASSYKSF